MKIFSYINILALEPCYDPVRFIPYTWEGTAVDILKVWNCPPNDRLWVVLRQQFIEPEVLDEYALWCMDQIWEAMHDQYAWMNEDYIPLFTEAMQMARKRENADTYFRARLMSVEKNAAFPTNWICQTLDYLVYSSYIDAKANHMQARMSIAMGYKQSYTETWNQQVAKLIELLS